MVKPRSSARRKTRRVAHTAQTLTPTQPPPETQAETSPTMAEDESTAVKVGEEETQVAAAPSPHETQVTEDEADQERRTQPLSTQDSYFGRNYVPSRPRYTPVRSGFGQPLSLQGSYTGSNVGFGQPLTPQGSYTGSNVYVPSSPRYTPVGSGFGQPLSAQSSFAGSNVGFGQEPEEYYVPAQGESNADDEIDQPNFEPSSPVYSHRLSFEPSSPVYPRHPPVRNRNTTVPDPKPDPASPTAPRLEPEPEATELERLRTQLRNAHAAAEHARREMVRSREAAADLYLQAERAREDAQRAREDLERERAARVEIERTLHDMQDLLNERLRGVKRPRRADGDEGAGRPGKRFWPQSP